jgi:hypothetical protein
LLNIQLLHDAAEGLLQTVNFFVELLSDLQLKLRVELLGSGGVLLEYFNFLYHFLDHLLHINNYKVLVSTILLLEEQFMTSCFICVCFRMHLEQKSS